MLLLAVLLAQSAAATPSPSPTAAAPLRPAPLLGRAEQGARPKTLSEHAAEMKARGTPARRVSFDDLESVEPGEALPPAKEGGATAPKKGASSASSPEASAAAEAQRRMDRAVERGLALPDRTRSSARDKARREWDDAAEACRRTPGCVPQYRDDVRFGEGKPLKTDAELIEETRRRGFSEPHPLPK